MMQFHQSANINIIYETPAPCPEKKPSARYFLRHFKGSAMLAKGLPAGIAGHVMPTGKHRGAVC